MLTRLRKLLWAYGMLAIQALFVQPWRRLRQLGTTGEQRFLEQYGVEGLLPLAPDARRRRFDHQRCIHCGLCDTACEVLARVSRAEAPALSALPVAYSRSMPEYPYARVTLAHLVACEDCDACEAICPTGVPLRDMIDTLRDELGALDALPPGPRALPAGGAPLDVAETDGGPAA